MEFKFKIRVGATEIEINESAGNQREFFEKIAFFSGLPTKAPGGADDLKIVYRKTKSNDEFYSIVSESEKQEYKFGIHKSAEKTLFPKGWEPLYERGNDDGGQEGEVPAQQNKPAAGKPAFARGAVAAPAKEEQAEAQEAVAESIPTPSIATTKLGNVPKPSGNAPAAPTAPGKPAGTSPAVNSVLSKYLKK